MREYWWSYALNKAKTAGTSQAAMEITPRYTPSGDVMWNRLKATSQLTTGQFGLGSVMQGAYSNKEQANQWFNRLMSDFTRTTGPQLLSAAAQPQLHAVPPRHGGAMLMQFVERSGKAGPWLGAIAGLWRSVC